MLSEAAMRRPAIAALRMRRGRGVTLVELLVAMALGLIVTVAMLLLFANASAHGQDIARTGVQIETGRYVSELLREDLRLAGFFGETSVAGAAYSQPDPCSTAPVGWGGAPLLLPAPIQGHAAADVVPCLDNRRPGTDALTVRRVGVDAIDPAGLAAGNTQYHVQYSYCLGDVASPRLVFATDRAAFTLRNRACTALNQVRPYVSRTYYIADCNRCGVGGDSIPTLKRVELAGNQLVTMALAEGVETLRFEYGFDLDNDGSPDRYQAGLGVAGPSAEWPNVMALKAHFVSRSLDKATGANLATGQQFQLGTTPVVATVADGYSRKAYSSAIRLINPSAFREVQ